MLAFMCDSCCQTLMSVSVKVNPPAGARPLTQATVEPAAVLVN